MKQLLHRNNPWAGAPCYRAATCLSCASDKDSKDNCSKRSIVYEVHCSFCREEARRPGGTGGRRGLTMFMLVTALNLVILAESVTRLT